MTEKTLSEQICEVCGIKYEREVIDPLYKSMCNNGDPRCTQISKTIKKKLDLQNNNNNFVKLLELNINDTECTILHFICIKFKLEDIYNKKDILECVLQAIKDDKSGLIAKSIRQADWEVQKTCKKAIKVV